MPEEANCIPRNPLAVGAGIPLMTSAPNHQAPDLVAVEAGKATCNHKAVVAGKPFFYPGAVGAGKVHSLTSSDISSLNRLAVNAGTPTRPVAVGAGSPRVADDADEDANEVPDEAGKDREFVAKATVTEQKAARRMRQGSGSNTKAIRKVLSRIEKCPNKCRVRPPTKQNQK